MVSNSDSIYPLYLSVGVYPAAGGVALFWKSLQQRLHVVGVRLTVKRPLGLSEPCCSLHFFIR